MTRRGSAVAVVRLFAGALVLGAVWWSVPVTAAAAVTPAEVQDPCEATGTDPWVVGLRDRILNFNELAAHAVRRYGPPSACDGSVTDDYNGAKFGIVTLSFGDDVTLSVETFPPEASIVSFSDASGFDDERAMRELLLAYTADVGLRVDWSLPDVRRGEGTRVETYFDAHPGMNASVALHYTAGALTQIRVTLAL